MSHPKKKILHLAEAFDGGVYFFLRDLVNRPELQGFDFEILYGVRREKSPAQLRNDFPNAKLTYWPGAQREIRPLQDLKALRWAVKYLRETEPDLIHCHSSKAGVLGRLAAFRTSKKNRVLYSPHGLAFLKLDDPPWKRRFYALIEKISAGFGGLVVGCSASEVQALKSQGIDAILIQNGVEFPEASVSETFASPAKVVTVGQIYVPKYPTLFDEIAGALPNIQFVWVGDGPLRHMLKAKNIQITGWIPRDEVSRHLQDAQVYLSTSLWEGLPLSVLEAMAMGRALLLRRCVGNVDLVNEKNGFIFSEKDEAVQKIAEMISDESKLRDMGSESRRLVQEDFSLAQMARKYLELYSEVIRQSGSDGKTGSGTFNRK